MANGAVIWAGRVGVWNWRWTRVELGHTKMVDGKLAGVRDMEYILTVHKIQIN